jgi:mannose-6-phosphate isomerase-like protein (cupin superfamily)
MSDYSIANLHEIENSASTEGLKAYFARKHLDSTDIGVTLMSYQPNFKASMAHKHKVQEEAYVVIKGSGKILLDSRIIDLKMWDVVRVAPSVTRAFEAGPDGLDIIAVGGPKPAEGDGVRQEANWPA